MSFQILIGAATGGVDGIVNITDKRFGEPCKESGSIIYPPISQNWQSTKEPLSLHGSLKISAGRLTIPSTPPVAALINIWKLIVTRLLTGPQQLRKPHLSRV